MASKDKPSAERRKKSKQDSDERMAEKKAERREKKHNLKVLKRKSQRTGHGPGNADSR